MVSIRARTWLVCCSLLAALVGDGPAAASAPPARVRTAPPRATEALRRAPLIFVENRGQTDERVSHYVGGRDATVFFTATGVTYALDGEGRRYAVTYDFVGADPGVRARALDRTPAVISHFRGPRSEWKTGLATFSTLVYPDLWPGIDLTYTAGVDRLKYAFTVRPGADPSRVRIACRGADSMKIGEGGELTTTTPVATLTNSRPASFQDVDGRRTEVASEFVLATGADGEAPAFGFQLGAYDAGQTLVIDPAVVVYGGFLGGADTDIAYGVAVDGAGNAYVTGSTESDQTTFPAGPGFGPVFGGSRDAFVAKVKADGSGLVYAGYIGGSASDEGYGIAVDGAGSAYVTGVAASDTVLAVSVGPDLSSNGLNDAFVAKVKADGSGLDYAGYIGGAGDDSGKGIAVDAAGNAYVTGDTHSDAATFPEAVGPDLTYGGLGDAFVARVNSGGTSLDWCGYVGGSAEDLGGDIDVDATGVYVVGSAEGGAFPAVPGFDATHNGGEDAFVAKLSSDGAAFVYAGYLGGSRKERGLGIAVDAGGRAYVTGISQEGSVGFPATGGPDLTHDLGDDAFVAEIDAAGTALVYAGFIGGSGGQDGDDDEGLGIAVDGSGNAYVVGLTESSEATFPVSTGPDTTFNGGDYDAFLVKIAGSPPPPPPPPVVSIDAFLLATTCTTKVNATVPAKSKLSVAGILDLGSATVDLRAAASFHFGALTLDFPAPTAQGAKLIYSLPGATLTLTPSAKGGSRVAFALSRTGDLAGVPTDGSIVVCFQAAAFEAEGSFVLAAGKFKLGKVAGGLIIPCLFPAGVAASLKGTGKDKLTLTAGFSFTRYVGGPGDVNPCFTIGFGDTFTATIDRALFTRKGDKLTFKGNVNGITSVVIDLLKELITVKGSKMTLTGVAAASGPLAVTMTLDTVALGVDTRTVTVRLDSAGTKLTY